MNILLQVLIWQFFDVPRTILKAWQNFLLFNLNYFSLPILLRTFFSHWRRHRSLYGKPFELWKNLEAFVFNMMSRVVGAILRAVFIVVGLLVEIFIILLGAIIFLGWLILPFLLVFFFIFGLKLLLF